MFLGLFSMPQGGDLASAADEVKGLPCEVPHGQNATRAEQAETKGTHMISGEVMRVEDTNYLLREESGKEVTVKDRPEDGATCHSSRRPHYGRCRRSELRPVDSIKQNDGSPN